MGANATAVDRFTYHSDVASIMRQYFDKNMHALIAEVKDESAGESESEVEAEEELILTNHTPDTVGLSPQEEFSPIATIFRDNNTLHNFIRPNSYTSESFQHRGSNKQRGSTSSLEEIMHDMIRHAISSKREVSFTFVPPYMKIPPRKRRKRRKLVKMELQPVPRVSQREAKGQNNNKTERKRARKEHNELLLELLLVLFLFKFIPMFIISLFATNWAHSAKSPINKGGAHFSFGGDCIYESGINFEYVLQNYSYSL
ncbi:MAG: hypothetical protein EZS28_027321 [Streblomastix strix]|uniref:Uncharacterized protein n=1 Tax=Streblomastix strix TaxID=222440 RepID=A0A5J4V419_9EUKA|nr:MAG: hypothetical protein EZS28_027321 [Streblomastix strix]